MSSRIGETFSRLQAAGQTGLITYVTAGDPDSIRSGEILKALDQAGADVLELGVPFSDPLADGPVIQRASERALAGGTSLASTLNLIQNIRLEVEAAIVVFTYANPVFRMGPELFVNRAADAGVDGVLVLDLPIEEAGPLRQMVVDAGMDPIFLLSPTTSDRRLARAAELGRGFLYGISRLGVTGIRSEVAVGVRSLVRRIRAVTSLPVAVGFGLSRPEHLLEVGKCADAAVVGSALVDVIARERDSPGLVPAVANYVRWLKGDGAAKAKAVVS